MTGPRLPDYLEHIRQAALEVMGFVQGMDKPAFLEDRRTQHAVIWCLVVIGEAATKIMDTNAEFTKKHPEAPWQKMRGMRNHVVHGYFDLNLDMVWNTVTESLPALLEQLPAVESQTQSGSENPPES